MNRDMFRRVERELYEYRDTLKDLKRMREEILTGTPERSNTPGGGRGNRVGDPTGRAAVLLSDRRLQHMERVIRAIQEVWADLSPQKRRLILLRYWSGRRRSWEEIARDLGISRMTAHRWRKEIVRAIADRLGWKCR